MTIPSKAEKQLKTDIASYYKKLNQTLVSLWQELPQNEQQNYADIKRLKVNTVGLLLSSPEKFEDDISNKEILQDKENTIRKAPFGSSGSWVSADYFNTLFFTKAESQYDAIYRFPRSMIGNNDLGYFNPQGGRSLEVWDFVGSHHVYGQLYDQVMPGHRECLPGSEIPLRQELLIQARTFMHEWFADMQKNIGFSAMQVQFIQDQLDQMDLNQIHQFQQDFKHRVLSDEDGKPIKTDQKNKPYQKQQEFVIENMDIFLHASYMEQMDKVIAELIALRPSLKSNPEAIELIDNIKADLQKILRSDTPKDFITNFNEKKTHLDTINSNMDQLITHIKADSFKDRIIKTIWNNLATIFPSIFNRKATAEDKKKNLSSMASLVLFSLTKQPKGNEQTIISVDNPIHNSSRQSNY